MCIDYDYDYDDDNHSLLGNHIITIEGYGFSNYLWTEQPTHNQ
ncbi:MAG TPA: hypothetical protein VFM28_04295 [Nitrososphaeraceae archaeon]|nr:hypothetical protein [Nitrososphaeraceae archaeon]